MPCYSGPHDYCEHSKGECIAIKSDEYIKSVIDKLTQMLCHVMKEIEDQSFTIMWSKDIKEWWEKHKEFDKGKIK